MHEYENQQRQGKGEGALKVGQRSAAVSILTSAERNTASIQT
jgi:hypothetical protein